MRPLALLLLSACLLPAQQSKYSGPRPAKPDVPYLLHAGKLVETEVTTATESQDKDGTLYTIPGATSPARTPLPEPIFLIQSNKINPERLAVYKMEVRNNARTLLVPTPGRRKKDSARPIFFLVTPLTPGLFRFEINEFIDNGEYCLSPESSNQAFCFTTY